MTEQKLNFPPADFSHTVLPVVNKTVFRMGVAGNYGIDSADIRWAADYGANYWVWGRGIGKITDGIRKVIRVIARTMWLLCLGGAISAGR